MTDLAGLSTSAMMELIDEGTITFNDMNAELRRPGRNADIAASKQQDLHAYFSTSSMTRTALERKERRRRRRRSSERELRRSLAHVFANPSNTGLLTEHNHQFFGGAA